MLPRPSRSLGASALLVASLGGAPAIEAQFPGFPDQAELRRKAVIGNVLVGGVTAALRAHATKKSTVRALAWGLVGGAVIAGGKSIAAGPGNAAVASGTVLSTVGTAIVANAAAGRQPLSELPVSVAMVRLTVRPFDDDKMDFAINAYETSVIAHHFIRGGLAVDWKRSAQLGTFAFTTVGREIVFDGDIADGVASGPTAVVSEFARDPEGTWRHEAVHVHQHRFAQHAVGLPVESALRERFRLARRIPRWIDLGVLVPLYGAAEWAISGRNGVTRKLGEQDADAFERR